MITMFNELTKFLENILSMGVPSVDCIVYKDGKEVYRYMNGYSSLEEKIPVNGKERYNIYSCTKPITCSAALKLWEEGKFGLDDDISDYLPEFKRMYVKTETGVKETEKSIKIRDLFRMTAGLSYDVKSESIKRAISETNGRCPTRETIKYIAKEPLLFEPSQGWEYSLCHDVLAGLIEVVSDMKFSEYIQKNVFEPLGMEHSAFYVPDEELYTLAEQYNYDSEEKRMVNCGKYIQDYKFGSEYESGGAGCISTVDDYIKFVEALRKGDKIIKKETVAMLSTNQLNEVQARSFTVDDYGYGLGVRCPISPESENSDFGWGGAAGSCWCVDIKNGLTVFYAQHVLNAPNTLTMPNIRKRILMEL